MTIAERIILLRVSQGWSQRELARRSNVTAASICTIEKYQRYPSGKTLDGISKAFNISINQLMGDQEIPGSNHEKNFYVNFGFINKLSDEDKKIIITLAKRLLNV